MRPGPSSWENLMLRAFVGSCWLGLGCPVLRADTRENPVGKNGVMTESVVDVGGDTGTAAKAIVDAF